MEVILRLLIEGDDGSMSRTLVETMHMDEFILRMSSVQRDLSARLSFPEAHAALDAIRRLSALDRQHAKKVRYAAPLGLRELALPGRLRDHVAKDEVHTHSHDFLEAATRIEKLEQALWKLPAAPVQSNQLTAVQLTGLLHDKWPDDRQKIVGSLQYKGYLDKNTSLTAAGHSFIWRLMERALDRTPAEIRGAVPIIRMDSELLDLLGKNPRLCVGDWNGRGFAVMSAPMDQRPEALLHPYYVWQIRVEKSAGLLLGAQANLPWATPITSSEAAAPMAA